MMLSVEVHKFMPFKAQLKKAHNMHVTITKIEECSFFLENPHREGDKLQIARSSAFKRPLHRFREPGVLSLKQKTSHVAQTLRQEEFVASVGKVNENQGKYMRSLAKEMGVRRGNRRLKTKV